MKSYDRLDAQASPISNTVFWLVAAFLIPFVCMGLGLLLGDWSVK